MKKCIALLTALALVIVVISGMALAGPTKLTLNPYPFGDPIEPGASGKAIMNWPKGNVFFQLTVNAKGLTADTDYRVFMGDGLGNWEQVGTLSTNGNGEGSFHRNWKTKAGDTLPLTVQVALNGPTWPTVLLNP